jgi:hypothetical protein
MSRISWWLVDTVSRLLEPDEREAVRGDFMESGVSGGQALLDVLGLVIRRQAALWVDWRLWLGLVGVVVPLGMLLSHVSRRWADGSAVYAWLYVNNWTWAFLESPGARRDLAGTVVRFCLNSATLTAWSWTSGFVLGSLSRRAVLVNGGLFCFALFAGTFASIAGASRNPSNPAFSLTFYSVAWPVILQTLLVVLPGLWGMRKGRRLTALPLRQAIVGVVVVAALTARAVLSLEGRNWLLGFLPLLAWPVGYMVAMAGWRHWRRRTASV